MSKPLVSTIITYYKKKKYINDTLKSAVNQTYSNHEIILVYDDSDKKDLDYIKNLIKPLQKVNLIVNKNNLGAGQSRNEGLKFASGEYIAFLDGDDLWKKNKIERQVLFMIKNKINFSHTSYDLVDKNSIYLHTYSAINIENYDQILTSCDVGLSTVMIKKDLKREGFEFSNLRTKEDFYLWLLLLKRGTKLYGLNENLSQWRRLKNSLSSSFIIKLHDGFKLYNKYLNYSVLKSLYLLTILSINFIKKNIKKR